MNRRRRLCHAPPARANRPSAQTALYRTHAVNTVSRSLCSLHTSHRQRASASRLMASLAAGLLCGAAVACVLAAEWADDVETVLMDCNGAVAAAGAQSLPV